MSLGGWEIVARDWGRDSLRAYLIKDSPRLTLSSRGNSWRPEKSTKARVAPPAILRNALAKRLFASFCPGLSTNCDYTAKRWSR
jgi:hypothetical protein